MYALAFCRPLQVARRTGDETPEAEEEEPLTPIQRLRKETGCPPARRNPWPSGHGGRRGKECKYQTVITVPGQCFRHLQCHADTYLCQTLFGVQLVFEALSLLPLCEIS